MSKTRKPAAPHGGVPGFIRRRGGVSLSVTLAVSISMLVLVAVVGVLGLGLWSGSRNTTSLLHDKARLVVSAVEDRIRGHLDPARDQIAFVERLIAGGAIDPGDERRFVDTLTGALAAAPQINAILFIDTGYQAFGVARTPKGVETIRQDYAGDARVRTGMAAARTTGRALWGEPLWRDAPQQTMLNARQPVFRDGVFQGLFVAAVSMRELSTYLASLKPAVGSNVFILYDRTHVIAHPNLQSGVPGLSHDKPLPTLAETGDPVLSAIWRQEDRYPLEVVKGGDLQGHVLELFNEGYIFIYRELRNYGGRPWQVGSYFRAAEVNTEMRRLLWAAVAGLGMLVVSLLAAILLGKRIARPVVELAAAASQIGKLEISKTTELPGSIFRELNDQAHAFNTMLRGLRWFEAYVPRKLVGQLMRYGDAGSVTSGARNVTVMFTDIAGFSRMSEGQPAAEVAAFLNKHFALQASCIDEEGGTVDKFMGDSVMAFWGAPEKQKNRATRACRAALSIAVAVRADNKARRAAGQEPVNLRIGIHSGRVTVGNIGAPGRVNYTIIGDTVNVAQRLEQLGKELCPDAKDVAILISGATAADLDDGFEPVPMGRHHLRGRGAEIAVFRLA